jgi:hypothetical protein
MLGGGADGCENRGALRTGAGGADIRGSERMTGAGVL